MVEQVFSHDASLESLDLNAHITRPQFKQLLTALDQAVKPLAPTAQVAKQEGEYLAHLFSHHELTGRPGTSSVLSQAKPFSYFHKGSLAYVGDDRAVMQVPGVGAMMGPVTGLLWKGYETMSQFSLRNQMLVAFDWVRSKAFGRDQSML
jgi:NADH:ubiquinone reductase (non-electrogenic)